MSAEYARMVHVTALMLTAAQREPRLRLCPSSLTIDRFQPIRNRLVGREAHHQLPDRDSPAREDSSPRWCRNRPDHMHHSTTGCVFWLLEAARDTCRSALVVSLSAAAGVAMEHAADDA